MKKNIFINILFVSILSIAGNSCKKSFLEINSQQSTDSKVAIVDIQSMRAAINGVYDLMQDASYYGRTTTLLPDLMGDNSYVSDQNAGRYLDNNQYTTTEGNSYARDAWNQIYRIITNCNFIIQKGSPLEVPDGNKEEQGHIIGEAYTIRALAHFDLCRLYAQPYTFTADASHPGIPIVTMSSASIEDLIKPARNTVKEVYDTIISDLQQAISMLKTSVPGKSSSFKGMVTLNAAKGILSRVYLYKGDWSNAEKTATEVIDSKQYKLLPGTSLVSDFGAADNSETIFEIQYSDIDNQGTNSLAYMYNQAGYGDILATQDLYNQYSANDARRGFMIIGNRNSKGGEKNVPLVLKYNNVTTIYAGNIKIIRLAEVYLNRAEARAHLNEDADAINDLKTIAMRGDPGVVIDPALTGQPLIDMVLLERRKELAFEGDRLYDLTRNKISFKSYTSGGSTINVDYPMNKAILPIPETETDVNTNIQQNAGY